MPTTTTLTTYTAVQTRLGLTGTTSKTVIEQIIDGVTDQFAKFLKRPIFRSATRTDLLTGDWSNVLQLTMFPVESITSVKVAADVDFASATALTANDDYRFEPESGLLFREADVWPKYRRGIQVIYVAGYVHPDDTPTGDNVALPDDIISAAIQQTVWEYNQRKSYGQKGERTGDGSVTLIETADLLPSVKRILEGYKTPVV